MKNITTLPLSIALALAPYAINASRTNDSNIVSEAVSSVVVSQHGSTSLNADQKERLRNLIQTSGASLNEKEMNDLANTINYLTFAKPEEHLKTLMRMKNSRILERCSEAHEIIGLLNTISTFSEERYQTVLKKIKKSEAWGKRNNADEIRGFLVLYGNLETAFLRLDGSLIRTCLIDYGHLHLEDLLRWHERQNNLPAMTILRPGEGAYDEKDLRANWQLYLFYHVFYAPNKQIEGVVKDMILKGSQPERTLGKITNLLDEDHPFSQACSTLLLSRQKNPEKALETPPSPSSHSVKKHKSSSASLRVFHRPRQRQDDVNRERLAADQDASEDTPLIL